MDIEAAVQRLSELSTEIGHAEDPVVSAALAEEMAQTWDGIDGWLRHGGLLPARWDR